MTQDIIVSSRAQSRGTPHSRAIRENCLKFKVGKYRYRVRIGPKGHHLLDEDGRHVKSMCFLGNCEILISSIILPNRWTEELFFCLRCAWHYHYGQQCTTLINDAKAISHWAIDMMRQFAYQGGEGTLCTLKPVLRRSIDSNFLMPVWQAQKQWEMQRDAMEQKKQEVGEYWRKQVEQKSLRDGHC